MTVFMQLIIIKLFCTVESYFTKVVVNTKFHEIQHCVIHGIRCTKTPVNQQALNTVGLGRTDRSSSTNTTCGSIFETTKNVASFCTKSETISFYLFGFWILVWRRLFGDRIRISAPWLPPRQPPSKSNAVDSLEIQSWKNKKKNVKRITRWWNELRSICNRCFCLLL